MSKFNSIIFEGKPHPVVRVKVENKKHPPPPHKSDYPIPATPPGMKKRMEKRGDDKAVRAWLERQLKPYQSALAKWEKQWAEKPRFLHVITVDLLAQRWSGHFMGKPGGPKFSEADLIGSEILSDGALRLVNGKGIRGHVDHLTANEIRDNREILSARDGGVVHPVEAVSTSTVSGKRGRPPRDHEADAKIVKRWHDARAITGISIPTFLTENPDILRWMPMTMRVQEMRRVLNAAGKKR